MTHATMTIYARKTTGFPLFFQTKAVYGFKESRKEEMKRSPPSTVELCGLSTYIITGVVLDSFDWLRLGFLFDVCRVVGERRWFDAQLEFLFGGAAAVAAIATWIPFGGLVASSSSSFDWGPVADPSMTGPDRGS